MVYLAGKYGETGTWWSNDIEEQALIVSWLAFASSWIQYGLCTARAIINFKGPHNGLGEGFGEEGNKTLLRESHIRATKSLEILENSLEGKKWLVLNRPTVADIAVFVYVDLAPMGGTSLDCYKNIVAWVESIKNFPNFIPI